jgi:phosphoribosylamine--glycine ligase
MGMKALIIGSGGREHALIWKLKQSKKIDKVFCAPGNGGITQGAKCINIGPDNIKGLCDFAHRNKIGLTVVGPEDPLAAGIVDEFHKRKLRIFGPDKEGARLEASKVFAKEFMRKHHIPTAPFKVFDSVSDAIGFCKSVEFPVVIKADGLAAGKGAVVVKNIDQATQTLDEIMVKKVFGKAGKQVVIESFLKGQELSIMAICDGKSYLPLLPSQDHKQAFDGDKGPNTGGMGAYCPVPFVDDDMLKEIEEHVLVPTIDGLKTEGIKYRGVIYAGLMMTAEGPRVLEYNVRFGDPETQVVLPLLKSDLADLMLASVNGKLGSFGKLDWREEAAVCVIMASKGYPGKYKKGVPINGLQVQDNRAFIFHAGTSRKGNRFFTNGGRVLGVMAHDKSLNKSLSRAYKIVDKVKFDGAHYRKDIGSRAEQQVA